MKTYAALFLICASGIIHAQSFYYGPPGRYMNEAGRMPKDLMKKAHVQKREQGWYNKKGQLTDNHVTIYNKSGNEVQVQRFNRKNELKSTTITLFWNDTLYAGQVTLNNKSDTVYQGRLLYDNKGTLIGSYYASRKRITESRYTYNDKKQRVEVVTIVNGKPKWTIAYEYNDSGKLVSSMQYDVKNKLKRRTTYLCDYRGETVSAGVKQLNMCTHKDTLAGGGFILYDDRTDEKGKLSRYIYTYDADTNMTRWESYNRKGRLVSKMEYAYDRSGNRIKQVSYGKNNRLQRIIDYSFNDKNLLLTEKHRLSASGEIRWRQVYQYNYYQ